MAATAVYRFSPIWRDESTLLCRAPAGTSPARLSRGIRGYLWAPEHSVSRRFVYANRGHGARVAPWSGQLKVNTLEQKGLISTFDQNGDIGITEEKF